MWRWGKCNIQVILVVVGHVYFPLEEYNVTQSHSCVPQTSLSSLHFAQSSEVQIHIKRHIYVQLF